MVKIKAIVAKVYEPVEGTYLGSPYKYVDVVANEVPEEGDPYRGGRIAFRLKGEQLEKFNAFDVGIDGCPHVFTLCIDAKETRWKDDSVHPVNLIPICVGWE